MDGGETKFLEQRHEVKNAHPTWEKSEEILDYKDTIDLETGLRDMWNWAKEQPNRERFVWPKYELDEGIFKNHTLNNTIFVDGKHNITHNCGLDRSGKYKYFLGPTTNVNVLPLIYDLFFGNF